MAEYSYDQVMTALRNADSAGDTEAATRLATIAKGLQNPAPEATPQPKTNMWDEMLKGTGGALTAGLDLAAGLPKAFGAVPLAAIKTAGGMDADTARKEAAATMEGIVGTPSQGLTGFGIPKEYTTETLPYKAITAPFNWGGEKVEGAGEFVKEKTGSSMLGGLTKQGLDIGLLAMPIPGGKALKRVGGKVLERFVKEPNATELKADLGYGKTEPIGDWTKAFDETVTQEKVAPTQQMELDLGQPDMFGQRPSEFVLDENGIPIKREASLEAQTGERGGDLFSQENIMQQGISENIANWEMPNEARGAIPDREYLKQQEVEQAYVQKAKQDVLDLEEALNLPAQGSQNLGLGKGVGKYQGGALDPQVFLEGLDKMNEALSAATDKLAGILKPAFPKALRNADDTVKILVHNTNAEFDPRMIDARGDLGVHVGTSATSPAIRGQAKLSEITPNMEEGFFKKKSDFLRETQEETFKGKGEKTLPYILDSDKVIKLEVDAGNWETPAKVAQLLKEQGIFTERERAAWENQARNLGEERAMKSMRQYMINRGIDAIEYVNKYEKVEGALGEPTSLVVLNKDKLVPLSDAINSAKGRELPPNLQGEQQLFGGFDVQRLREDLTSIYKDIKPESLDDFLMGIRNAGVNVSDKAAEILYNGLKQEQQSADVITKQNALNKFANKVSPEFDRYMSIWKDKTPQEAVDIVKASVDAPEASLGVYHEVLGTRGRLGAQKVSNDGVRNGLAYLAQSFENARLEGARLLSGGVDNFNSISRKLETVFGHGDAGEVFSQLAEKQANPEFQFRLKPTQQKMLAEIKRVTDQTWDMIVKQVEQMNPTKAEKLRNMKQEYYLPHSWSGDFVSYVRDAEGRLVSFIAERTLNGAKKAVEHLRQELGSTYTIEDPIYAGGKTKQLGKKSIEGKAGTQAQEAFAGQFDMLIDMLTSDDPVVQKAMTAVQSTMNRQAMATAGMKQHMKHSAGVGGFLGSKGWKSAKENYFDMKKSFQNYVESAYDWKGKMDGANFLAMLKDQAPDKVNTYSILRDQFMQSADTFKEVSPTVKTLENTFAKSGYSPKELNFAARKLSNFITLQQVGFGNVIQMIQNFVQSPATQLWSYGNMIAHGAEINPLVAGKNMLMSMWEGMTAGQSNPKWLKYAQEHEINKIGLVEYPERTKLTAGVKNVAAINIKASESSSRIGYFFATTKDLMRAGYPEDIALDMAKNMTRDHMGNMERHAKPGIVSNTGAAGELLGRLQSYSSLAFEMFTQSMLDAAQGLKTANPKLLLPLAGYLYAQYLTGGVNGTIPMDVAEKSHWLGVMAGVIPPEWRSPRQYMLEENPKAAISPMSRIGPMWVEGSFRNNLPFLGAPVVQMATKKAPAISEAMKWVYSLADKSKEPTALGKAEVLREALPASMRGVSEQMFMKTKTGTIVTPSGRPSHKPTEDTRKIGQFTNVRTPERGFEAEVSNLTNAREFRINEARSALEKDFNKHILNTQLGQPVSAEYLKKTIKRDFELGGDPDALIGRAVKFAEEANYPNSVVVQLIRSEKNPFKQRRLAEAYSRITEGIK